MDYSDGHTSRCQLCVDRNFSCIKENGNAGRCHQPYCFAWNCWCFSCDKKPGRDSDVHQATVSGLLTAFLVQLLHSKGIQSDAAIGVVFTSLFAVGVILLSVYGANVHLDIEHSLMGEIAFVPWNTVTIFGVDIGPKAFWMLVAVSLINITMVSVCYKEFKIASFDPQMALAIGIPVMLIHYLQMGMLSLTTVASFDSVGAILVVAMLIVPPSSLPIY